MKVSDRLGHFYDGYYHDSSVLNKRQISARQTVAHLRSLLPPAATPFRSLLDVGAGDGAVLAELERVGVASELHAVEISESGCEAIRKRGLKHIGSVKRFDGYKIDAPADAYSLGIAAHVLEHVEHERSFLGEIARVCQTVYVEVPLELTLRVGKAIRLSADYGHINFYNPDTFRNLLVSSGLEVTGWRVFVSSLEYETLIAGPLRGRLKFLLRSALLRTLPSVAPHLLSYVGGALCRRAP
jgi:hypothetical protein